MCVCKLSSTDRLSRCITTLQYGEICVMVQARIKTCLTLHQASDIPLSQYVINVSSYMFVCVCVCVHIYIYMYIWVCVCVCVCIYIISRTKKKKNKYNSPDMQIIFQTLHSEHYNIKYF